MAKAIYIDGPLHGFTNWLEEPKLEILFAGQTINRPLIENEPPRALLVHVYERWRPTPADTWIYVYAGDFGGN